MAKYRVYGIASASVVDTVEANSPEEAMDKAELFTGLCYQCSRTVEIGDIYDVEAEIEE